MNYLKDFKIRVNYKAYAIISIILGFMFHLVEDYSLISTVIFSSIFFLLIAGLSWTKSYEIENDKKREEERFGDDPDWEKFKELKKKFRQ